MIRFLCFDRLILVLALSFYSCALLNASQQLTEATENVIEGSSLVARLEPPHSLYKFFGLGNLQSLSSDIRRKLIPMSFCGSLERTPLREWQKEDLLYGDDTEYWLNEVIFSQDGSHIVIIGLRNCIFINVASGAIVNKHQSGSLNYISSMAFSPDSSKVTFIDNPNNRITERSLHNYEFQDMPAQEVALNNGGAGNDLLSMYDKRGKLIIVKNCRSIIIYDPADQTLKQFYEPSCESECKHCRNLTEICLNDTKALIVGPHGCQSFLFDSESWRSEVLDLDIDPPCKKIECLAFNEDGTLFLVGYGRGLTEDKIRIFDSNSFSCIQEISLGYCSAGPQSHFRDARFVCNSQCILLLRAYASQLYDIKTGSILAEYPHGSRAWRHEDRGYRLEKGKWIRAQELRAPNYEPYEEQHFAPSQQYMNSKASLFATLSKNQVKLYALPRFLSLFFDKDMDKGALERILFLQYLRIITCLGLRLTLRGLEVNPVVEKWQKVAPSSMCNELNNPSKREYEHMHVTMDELQAVFQSFSPPLQKLLKAQYHLPWKTL